MPITDKSDKPDKTVTCAKCGQEVPNLPSCASCGSRLRDAQPEAEIKVVEVQERKVPALALYLLALVFFVLGVSSDSQEGMIAGLTLSGTLLFFGLMNSFRK